MMGSKEYMDWDRPSQYQLKKKSAAYLEYGVGLGHLGITQVWFVDGACRLGSCHIFSRLLFGCIMFASSNFAFFGGMWCSPTRQPSFTDRNPVSKRLWLECLSLALIRSGTHQLATSRGVLTGLHGRTRLGTRERP